MSEEQLKAFIEKVKADTSLQEQLKAAADVDAALAIAKEAGFMLSADDIRTKISDDELEGAAGGGTNPCINNSQQWKCVKYNSGQ
ncbi:nif11-like leader peptide domain protein [Synechococcus sp. BIOS-E4-1]|uniref:Nif11-like leader peptide family natural product precursor n=1 Tax=Synechococcus sp. BIOS-E4-1 TaxID=1400864 RepID=UPI0016467E05|nr:Nif11-like leader peptide family natural product precursor [Synechococcus sp. BIOS-E4-1]QNI56294.1 nif11-like leader peptide domain protein [Synechococcus sp. BIOS-E4-1]